MQNRVFPNVHLTNSLHCNASDLKIPGVDGGLESTNTTSTVCTVMGQLAELYSAGKMAAYNERSGCIVTMTASDFSQLPEAMGALESTGAHIMNLTLHTQSDRWYIHIRLQNRNVGSS